MLVLTRKYQEKIRIGDNITITVLRTKGKAVRLGIEAPDDISVIRGELIFGATTQDGDQELPSSMPVTARRRSADRDFTQPAWAADSATHAQAESNPIKGRVEHKRVPRHQVPELLPQLMPATRPLRAMMDSK